MKRAIASPQIPAEALTPDFQEAALRKLAAGESLGSPRLQLGTERYQTIVKMLEQKGWPLPDGATLSKPPQEPVVQPRHRPAKNVRRDAQIAREARFDLAELQTQRERGWSNVKPDNDVNKVLAARHGLEVANVKKIIQRARRKPKPNL